MAGTATVNIRTDKNVKEHAEQIFNELGLSMSSAINMFLKTTIRENGIPFALKLDIPNEETAAAITEGKKLLEDASIRGYSNMDALRSALDD